MRRSAARSKTSHASERDAIGGEPCAERDAPEGEPDSVAIGTHGPSVSCTRDKRFPKGYSTKTGNCFVLWSIVSGRLTILDVSMQRLRVVALGSPTRDMRRTPAPDATAP